MTAKKKTPAKTMTQDEREIRDLIARWSRAVEAKDTVGIVEAYTPQTVLYDAIPPFKTVGAKAIAKLWDDCFPYFPDKFRSEHKDLTVEVSGDVAFVHAMHHFVPEPADHPSGSTWMRVTACYRRIEGQWRVVHEHVSVPFDPMTGKAVYITDPKGKAAAPAPEGPPLHSVTPHLVCAGAAKAIDFYKKAFDATELMRLEAPDGKLMHACVMINGSAVMLVDEFKDMGNVAPTSLKGTPVSMHLIVGDADAAAKQAVAAGAKVIMPVADMFWGDRYGVLEDPFGHRWSVATPKGKPMSQSELQDAARGAMEPGAAA